MYSCLYSRVQHQLQGTIPMNPDQMLTHEWLHACTQQMAQCTKSTDMLIILITIAMVMEDDTPWLAIGHLNYFTYK